MEITAMSRIPLPEPETLPPFLKALHDNAPEDDWSTRNCARAFAPHPDLFEKYLSFYYPFHSNDGVDGQLEPRLKELVRLRIATLNGCKSCKAARLVPDAVSEHEAAVGVDQRDDEPFTPRERAAIELAEAMALTHHDIDDDFVRGLKKHFSDAEMLELMMMAGQYIGLGRMLAVLQLETISCPI
jgi:alkylhydroperoxidase family enzyme